MNTHRLQAAEVFSSTSLKQATQKVGRFYSSPAFRGHGWPGAGNSVWTWPMTTGLSQWIYGVMDSPISLVRAIVTQDCGLMM